MPCDFSKIESALPAMADHERHFAEHFCELEAPAEVIVWMLRSHRRLAKLFKLLAKLHLSSAQWKAAVLRVWSGDSPTVVASQLNGQPKTKSPAKATPPRAKPPG